MVITASPTPQSPAPSTPPPQKFVIVASQQKPQQTQPASGAGHIVVHSSQPAIVRSQNVQSVVVTSGPAGAQPPQKVVVVGVHPSHQALPAASSAGVSQVTMSLAVSSSLKRLRYIIHSRRCFL
ncbi:unnamed protein product [Euphydryas editha]|nr:unnamed protein product [Euphydryas editha]